jgi:hypothetical protein
LAADEEKVQTCAAQFASNRSGENEMDGTEDLMQINIPHFLPEQPEFVCLLE